MKLEVPLPIRAAFLDIQLRGLLIPRKSPQSFQKMIWEVRQKHSSTFNLKFREQSNMGEGWPNGGTLNDSATCFIWGGKSLSLSLPFLQTFHVPLLNSCISDFKMSSLIIIFPVCHMTRIQSPCLSVCHCPKLSLDSSS